MTVDRINLSTQGLDLALRSANPRRPPHAKDLPVSGGRIGSGTDRVTLSVEARRLLAQKTQNLLPEVSNPHPEVALSSPELAGRSLAKHSPVPDENVPPGFPGDQGHLDIRA